MNRIDRVLAQFWHSRVGRTPPLRQFAIGTLAVHWIFLLKWRLLLQDDPRLVKRRRALVETNPPRNSQPETHRSDEPGGDSWVAGGLISCDGAEAAQPVVPPGTGTTKNQSDADGQGALTGLFGHGRQQIGQRNGQPL